MLQFRGSGRVRQGAEAPDGGYGEFEGVAVGIAEVNRRRVAVEAQFLLDGDAVLLEPFTPCGHLDRIDPESHMALAGGAVRRECASDARDLG